MPIIKTEFNNLIRDTSSKAILYSDDIAKEEAKKKAKKNKQQMEDIHSDIELLKSSISDINTLKEEIIEIKNMLKSFCSNKG
jgi:polyhydroxyalkanoate synthesis regulator phasin